MQRSRKRTVNVWCSTLLMVLSFALICSSGPALAQESQESSRAITIGEYFTRPKSDSTKPASSTGELPEEISPYVAAPKEPSGRPDGGGLLDFSEPKAGAKDWQQTTTVGESTFFDKLRSVAWSLAFVSLLIWGLGRFLGKGAAPGLSGATTTSHIEILERKRLTPGRSILLMRVGPKVLALASTESGFQTLTEMSAEELKLHQDTESQAAAEDEERQADPVVLSAPRTPQELAKHYLSILPGVGMKR